MAAPHLSSETPTTRDWTVTDDGSVVCFASENSHCVVVSNSGGFVTGGLTLAHDQDLVEATKQINIVLEPLAKKHQKNGRHLCILDTAKGPFLAWTREGFTRASAEGDIQRALKFQ